MSTWLRLALSPSADFAMRSSRHGCQCRCSSQRHWYCWCSLSRAGASASGSLMLPGSLSVCCFGCVSLVLTNLVFWGLAERLFHVRQGKRLFSRSGSGELAASILGCFATPLVVPVLGTHNLLLGSALSLLACLGLLIVTLRTCAAPLTTGAEEEPTAQSTPHS